MSIAQIAERLGRAPATIKGYFYDPTEEKARAVKARYVGVCRSCGRAQPPAGICPAVRAFQNRPGRGRGWPSWGEASAPSKAPCLTTAALLLPSGSGLPVGPAQPVEQERR
jgi:hypothetical protein